VKEKLVTSEQAQRQGGGEGRGGDHLCVRSSSRWTFSSICIENWSRYARISGQDVHRRFLSGRDFIQTRIYDRYLMKITTHWIKSGIVKQHLVRIRREDGPVEYLSYILHAIRFGNRDSVLWRDLAGGGEERGGDHTFHLLRERGSLCSGSCVTESVYKVVFKKSIILQIRQLILFYYYQCKE